jgi:hypothetical protein
LREVDLLDPVPIGLRPRLHSGCRTLTRAQQKLAEPMTRPQLILLGRLARTHQIAQCL